MKGTVSLKMYKWCESQILKILLKFQAFLLVEEIEPITGWRHVAQGAKTNNLQGTNQRVLNLHFEQNWTTDQSGSSVGEDGTNHLKINFKIKRI